MHHLTRGSGFPVCSSMLFHHQHFTLETLDYSQFSKSAIGSYLFRAGCANVLICSLLLFCALYLCGSNGLKVFQNWRGLKYRAFSLSKYREYYNLKSVLKCEFTAFIYCYFKARDTVPSSNWIQSHKNSRKRWRYREETMKLATRTLVKCEEWALKQALTLPQHHLLGRIISPPSQMSPYGRWQLSIKGLWFLSYPFTYG